LHPERFFVMIQPTPGHPAGRAPSALGCAYTQVDEQDECCHLGLRSPSCAAKGGRCGYPANRRHINTCRLHAVAYEPLSLVEEGGAGRARVRGDPFRRAHSSRAFARSARRRQATNPTTASATKRKSPPDIKGGLPTDARGSAHAHDWTKHGSAARIRTAPMTAFTSRLARSFAPTTRAIPAAVRRTTSIRPSRCPEVSRFARLCRSTAWPGSSGTCRCTR